MRVSTGPREPLAGASGSMVLMRHGETEWNRRGRVMGHLPIPLDDEGVAQAHAVVSLLQGAGIRRIVSSPLLRARQTADIVATDLQVLVEEDSELVEVDFGQWTGRSYDEIVGGNDFRRYVEDAVQVAPPGGENLGAVQRRGLAAIARILAPGSASPVLIVSHGDLLRSVLCHLLGADLAGHRRLWIDNCSISAADVSDGVARVRFVNAVAETRRLWKAPV